MMKSTGIRDDGGYISIHDQYSVFPAQYYMNPPSFKKQRCRLEVPTLSCRQAHPAPWMIDIQSKLQSPFSSSVRAMALQDGTDVTAMGRSSVERSWPTIPLQSPALAVYKGQRRMDNTDLDTELTFPKLMDQRSRVSIAEREYDHYDLVNPRLAVEPWNRAGKATRNSGSYDVPH